MGRMHRLLWHSCGKIRVWLPCSWQFCSTVLRCNPAFTGQITSQFCGRDEDCVNSGTGGRSSFLRCCNSIKFWVEETCQNVDAAVLDAVSCFKSVYFVPCCDIFDHGFVQVWDNTCFDPGCENHSVTCGVTKDATGFF